MYISSVILEINAVCDEGLGIVILEAMACETPVVATNKGGIPLAVKDGKTGFLVRAKSGKALSKAINKIISNPKLRKTMGENARKSVEEKFDWITIRDRVYKYYQKSIELEAKIIAKKLPNNITNEDLERERVELSRKIVPNFSMEENNDKWK
jgi:glycosyltransferase involved in cell wall biosynthesis